VTPLFSASSIGHVEVVKLLLEKGADMTAADNEGWTPLNSASLDGHIEVVKLLLEKGADVTVASNKGCTIRSDKCSSHSLIILVILYPTVRQ
jgi:ankyrin repeat protein